MKRTWTILLATAAAVVFGGIYFSRIGHAPVGQPPLVEINSATLSTLQSEFNQTSANLRVILLLSPT
jgi:hypothetical protein